MWQWLTELYWRYRVSRIQMTREQLKAAVKRSGTDWHAEWYAEDWEDTKP